MRTLSQTFTGADTWRLHIGGRYFRVISAASDIDVVFFRGGVQLDEGASAVGAGYYALPEGGFDRVDIVTAAAQTVKIAITDGTGGYDMVALAGTVDTRPILADTITDAAPVSVGVAATLLAAADTARKAVRFYNDGAAVVYVGGSAVTTANGAIRLAPGGTWLEFEAPGAAWYGISGTAAQSVRVQKLTVAP